LDPLLVDGLVAAGLTAASWLVLNWMTVLRAIGFTSPPPLPGGFGPPPPTASLGLWTYVLVAACFLPLTFRRRNPLTVLAFVTLAEAMFGLGLRSPAAAPVILGPLIALYTVGTRYDRTRLSLAAFGTGAILLASSLPPFSAQMWLSEFARVIAMVAFAAALGDAARTQRAYTAEAERRAEQAERFAASEAARRVDEERLHIARELHDATAHSLSLIAVQSGSAAHVLDAGPEAHRAFEDIRRTSREALVELRSVVGNLRAAGAREAEPAPARGLADLPDLVGSLAETGMAIAVRVDGDIDHLPLLVDASAYRIVQEALTNVMRHAGEGAATTVSVSRAADALTVEIVDDGTIASVSSEAGHGISGMRERALALGGTFEAGPVTDSGWRVYARIPLRARDDL
jgi:signal transduction histidine kinase